ncbi:alcohol dehydrogenase catalytic domain-containing protein [Salinifilum aidingensis]
MDARAVVIDEPEHLRTAPAEPRRPEAGEALVRVAWSGICGSDLEVYRGTRPAELVRYPVVPGHEWSGTVQEVGSGVDPDWVGKPVVGQGIRNCGTCPACRRGSDNLCATDYDETGFTRPGAWADHLVLPARLLHELPAHADLRAAAALEPTACAAAACLRLATVPGERAAVVGAGSLGLLATQLLAAAGPRELVVVHPDRDRTALAEHCGADRLVGTAEAEQWHGCFDAVLEAAGAPGTARQAIRLARRGGRVALTGLAAADPDPPTPVELVSAELAVHSVFGASATAWTHAVRAFTAGAVDPGRIITAEFGIDEAGHALQTLGQRRSDTVKMVLHP